jgi:hypothetical protein
MKLAALLFLLCALAALVPLRPAAPHARSADAFPGWAMAPLPAASTNIPLGPREARFAEDFPGRIGAFSDGTRTMVARWVYTPTRKLHPAADCLRALGYEIRPAPIFAAADGSHWAASNAHRGADRLCVRERIVDATGHEWTDVSAWFWAATLGHSAGPWWAITVFEPATLTTRL